jgi:hypothetical protein
MFLYVFLIRSFVKNHKYFLRRGQYSTITLAVYGRLSEGTPDPLLGRPAAVSRKKPASLPGTDFRVKEEPVRPPESPLPDGNARNGERFPDIFADLSCFGLLFRILMQT